MSYITGGECVVEIEVDGVDEEVCVPMKEVWDDVLANMVECIDEEWVTNQGPVREALIWKELESDWYTSDEVERQMERAQMGIHD